METGRGAVVGLLVEQGALKPGAFLVAGTAYGKVRTLSDFAGKAIKDAGPSTPVTVSGFKELPQFGDIFEVVKNEKEARARATVVRLEREKNAASANVTGADLLKLMTQQHEAADFNVIVKADVQGSLTSVIDSLKLIETGGEVTLHIVTSGVGNITENDIRQAADGKTVIYGFNVDLPPAVKQLATRERAEVRLYRVIYELLDDAKDSMEKLLAPEVVENTIGTLEVKGVFRTMKDQIITGGEVKSGKITPGLLVRAKRGDEVLGEAEITNLQREKIEVKEAFEGDLCGMSLKTTKKIQLEIGDTLEFFTREVVERKLG
jgi:translation initiation factor IF-2